MTNTLTDDERSELRDAARRLLVQESSIDRVRTVMAEAQGFDAALWRRMTELGWAAIALPERVGGLDASFADLAVVVHELGRQLTPSPMLASVLLAAEALSHGSNDRLAVEWLPDVIGGTRLLAVALANAEGSHAPGQLSVNWTRRGDTIVLNGVSRFVSDAHVADQLIVAARAADDSVLLAAVDRDQVVVDVEPTLDQTRRLCRVTLTNVVIGADRVVAEPDCAAVTYERLVARGAIAVLVDAVGAAERLLEISTDYAKARQQFGRPIGSFQAVKHHLANMFVDLEASRAAVAHAVEVWDEGGDVVQAAAAAKSFAAPACSRIAMTAIQVHGGIGFTWEHDAHLVLKRVKLAEMLFGSVSWHRRRLGASLVDSTNLL